MSQKKKSPVAPLRHGHNRGQENTCCRSLPGTQYSTGENTPPELARSRAENTARDTKRATTAASGAAGVDSFGFKRLKTARGGAAVKLQQCPKKRKKRRKKASQTPNAAVPLTAAARFQPASAKPPKEQDLRRPDLPPPTATDGPRLGAFLEAFDNAKSWDEFVGRDSKGCFPGAETSRLWQRVTPELRETRIRCWRCGGTEYVPKLREVRQHIAAHCPNCGKFHTFLRQAPPPADPASQKAKFIELVRICRANRYAPGFPVMAFRSAYGHLPPDLWLSEDWQAVEVWGKRPEGSATPTAPAFPEDDAPWPTEYAGELPEATANTLLEGEQCTL